jgi:hypothetical protein
LWEEGDKGPEGKSSWKKIKSKRMKPSYASPRDPQEINKRILKKKQTRKNNKSRPSWRIRGLITR